MEPNAKSLSNKTRLDPTYLKDRTLMLPFLGMRNPLISLKPGSKVTRKSRSVEHRPIYYRSQDLSIDWQASEANDISENGASVVTFHRFFSGEEIEIEMAQHLEGAQEVVHIEATIVWSRESENKEGRFYCGIVFKNKQTRIRREENTFFARADRHCHAIETDTQECIIQPAQNVEQLQDAFRLLYKEYTKNKLCPSHESQMHYTFHNLLPESRIFLLRRGGTVVGTVGCYPDSSCGLPMEVTFPQEIQQLRAQGRRLVEVGCLALNSEFFVKQQASLRNIERQSHLFKLCKTIINYTRLFSGATDMVIGCQPQHQILYKYLLFETISDVRTHQSVGNIPSVLMRLNFERFERYAVLFNSKIGHYILRDVNVELLKEHFPWTSQVVDKFLFSVRSIGENLSQSQKDYLKRCYYRQDRFSLS